MLLARETHWPERQIVHRSFTIRWTHGCLYSRLYGRLADDLETRWQIEAWAKMLAEIIPQLGGSFVSIIDTSGLDFVPRGLWLELLELTRSLPRAPLRRALLVAEGGRGDNHAETAQLVTAGSVRVFRAMQMDGVIHWLAGAGTIEAHRLRRFTC